MSDQTANENIETFFTLVNEHLNSGMPYRDAMELAAVIVGSRIAAKVSQAMAKYQEAIHPGSHLFREENKDALALLSMGVLWDNTYFNPIEPDPQTPLENVLAESVYFIMRYGEAGVDKVLEVSDSHEGDKATRAEMIARVIDKK
ncbi:MAG: hypothetical protein RLZZ428_230 [Pseudomonadota bacterium]